MAWEDFRDTVNSIGGGKIPDALASYDLIWGGADFNLDISYVSKYYLVYKG
jgi:hypothetical protein